MTNKNDGYSLYITIIAIASFTAFTTILFEYLTFYSNQISRINGQSISKERLIVKADEIISIIKKEYNDNNATSIYDGWFSKLPVKSNNIIIKIKPEDSKININHFDKKFLIDNKIFNPSIKTASDLPAFFETHRQLTSLVNEKFNDKSDCISFIMPFHILHSSLDENAPYTKHYQLSKNITEKIRYLRKNYNETHKFDMLAYRNIITLLNKHKHQATLLWEYRPTLNLNFIDYETFLLNMKYLKQENYASSAWYKIKEKRDNNQTIDSIDSIFTDNLKKYNSIFSTKSYLYTLDLQELDEKIKLSVLLKINTLDTTEIVILNKYFIYN